LDRIAGLPAEDVDDKIVDQQQNAAKPSEHKRDWGRHPLNLRVSLPLPFGRWYVTLVAGRERRGKERLIEERNKHPLDTVPNLMFLLSIGIVCSSLMLLAAALVLIHGYGWSIHLTIPA
jgi:hypothetical protein